MSEVLPGANLIKEVQKSILVRTLLLLSFSTRRFEPCGFQEWLQRNIRKTVQVLLLFLKRFDRNGNDFLWDKKHMTRDKRWCPFSFLWKRSNPKNVITLNLRPNQKCNQLFDYSFLGHRSNPFGLIPASWRDSKCECVAFQNHTS